MAHDLGDTLPFNAKAYDKDPAMGGVLVNATSVALTITLPDGTTSTPSVTNPPAVTGEYEYDYITTTQAGPYEGRWVFTFAGGATAAYVELFDVRPASPGYIVSVADAKAHLNKSSLDVSDDEELRPWIEAITRSISDYTGQVIIRTPGLVTRRHDTCYTDVLCSTHRPILELTSITSLDGLTTWPTAATDVDVDVDTGRLTALTRCWHGRLKITVTAGMTVVPANYRQAALYELRAHWATQQQRGLGQPTPFDIEQAPAASFAAPMTVELSPGARRLLGPRPPPVA